tara:strand:+ start:386 stop:871 length:486 start_codon:yes stop_codon:yes gene_type:complete
MSKFSIREQLLIFSLLLLILVSVSIWSLQQFKNQEKILKLKLDQLEIQIRQVRALSNEWEQVRSKITSPIMPQALSSFVESIARSLDIQDNLQLNVLTNVKKGMEGVKVGLDRLKLDHFLSMLYKLENHRPVLKISNLSISISPGNRKIRASFQVHKQQES